jgi:hypothetical protein
MGAFPYLSYESLFFPFIKMSRMGFLRGLGVREGALYFSIVLRIWGHGADGPVRAHGPSL